MNATMVRPLPEDLEREKKEGLLFQSEKLSFKAEIILCHSGVLCLEGYDYKVKFNQQIELLAGCFEAGSNLEEVLRNNSYLKHWERLYAILMPIGNIPVFLSRYNHDPKQLLQELKRQLTLEATRNS